MSKFLWRLVQTWRFWKETRRLSLAQADSGGEVLALAMSLKHRSDGGSSQRDDMNLFVKAGNAVHALAVELSKSYSRFKSTEHTKEEWLDIITGLGVIFIKHQARSR